MTILNKEKILEQAKEFHLTGKYEKAVKEYDKILLADPQDYRVKLKLAELYVKMKEISNALRLYNEVAKSYTDQGFYLKALTVYKNILRLNPSLFSVNEEVGSLYEKMGLVDDAIRQYDIVASSLEGKMETAHALELRKKIVDLSPENTKARLKLSDLYQCLGKNDESIQECEVLVKQLEKKGDSEDKRVELYEKILSYKPNQYEYVRSLVLLYCKRGDKKKAIEWLEKKAGFVEEDEELLGIQADIYASQNQLDSAVTKYYILADIYKDSGDIDKALEIYLKILVLIPDEQERIASEVQELKEGAWDILSGRWDVEKERVAKEEAQREAEERRRAEEERKRQEEEALKEKDQRKERRLKAKLRREGKSSDEESLTDSEDILQKDAVPTVKSEPAKPIAKEIEPKSQDIQKVFLNGEAALTLARAYFKTGLMDEFKEELDKAVSSFDKLKGSESEFPKLKGYISEIESFKKKG